jgi:hypothetical protein
MVKRGFSAWDFIKQEPKCSGELDLLSDVGFISVGGLYSTFGIDHTTTFYTPTPTPGQMRTIIDEDGYWVTQTFLFNDDGGIWYTTGRIESMITSDESITPKMVVPFWYKVKKFLKKQFRVT